MESGVAPAPKRGVCAIRKMLDAEGRGERDDRFAPMIHPDSADYAQEEVSCIGMEIYIYMYPRTEFLRDVIYFCK